MEPTYSFNFNFVSAPLICFCMGMCPDDSDSGTCETKPGGKCFAAIELVSDDDGAIIPQFTYGCLPPNEMALFQCQSVELQALNNRSIKCCDGFDYCNKHLLATLNDTKIRLHHPSTEKVLIASIIITIVIVLVGILIIYLKYQLDLKKKQSNGDGTDAIPENVELESVHSCVPEEVNPKTQFGTSMCVDPSLTNLSSAQLTTKGERTISSEISLEIMIGAGINTQIWRGTWRQTKVAVKIYKKEDEHIWLRELDIYQTRMVRHEHIVGYIASDIKNEEQRFTVLEYHPYGSLRHFLQHNTVTSRELIEIVKGLASGLAHLHTEIIGSKHKPIISHNNINSRNILVTAEKTCCFSDFSRAIKCKSNETVSSIYKDTFNSDVRYLAPEMLNHTFNDQDVASYMLSDVYSFALVVWEILKRCQIDDSNEQVENYRIPYDEELEAASMEPTEQNLLNIVVTESRRPKFKEEWLQNDILFQVVKIVSECWCGAPAARLPCLRIKKSLFKIMQNCTAN